eukprot:2849110-Prymnesium_polylepis.1
MLPVAMARSFADRKSHRKLTSSSCSSTRCPSRWLAHVRSPSPPPLSFSSTTPSISGCARRRATHGASVLSRTRPSSRTLLT